MKHRIMILTVAFAACSFSASSQTAGNKTTFGIRAGVNFQNLNGEDQNGDKLNNKLKTGFHAGFTADIPVAPDYYIQPALLYTRKGAKFKNEDKISLEYVELPVNFLYKPVLGDGRLLLGFGPYAAVAINGKYNSHVTENDPEIHFANTAPNSGTITFKRFDAGANFLAGYELNKSLSLQLNAQLGLLNIHAKETSIPNDKAEVKNTVFGLSVGYKF